MKRLRLIALIVAGLFIVGLITFFIAKAGKTNKAFGSYGILKDADAALLKDDLLTARSLYKKAQEELEDPEVLKELQRKIEDLNVKILFSSIVDSCSVKYTVKPGDSLARIAKEHGTTIELIMRANGLDSSSIRAGQDLKVTTCKFSVSVKKSTNTLLLTQGNDVVKTYIVSTGKNNSSPVGTFKIVNKLPNPTWFKTGAVIPANSPENILGTRWMGFDLKGYGIHGTTAPQELGKQVTLGCVRMKNEEVEELYDMLPVGTEVTIVD